MLKENNARWKLESTQRKSPRNDKYVDNSKDSFLVSEFS